MTADYAIINSAGPERKKKEEKVRESFKGGKILVQFNAQLLLKKNIYWSIYLSGTCNKSVWSTEYVAFWRYVFSASDDQ